MRDLSRPVIVAIAGATAVVVNLVVFGLGKAAGGDFRFTANGEPAQVDAVTLAGFSAVPLLIGLVVVALLSRFGVWVSRAAAVVAPVLAVATILAMTVPADLDTVSTITLSLCHLTLAPISVLAVIALGRRARPAQALVSA
jgi:hypothetical protein